MRRFSVGLVAWVLLFGAVVFTAGSPQDPRALVIMAGSIAFFVAVIVATLPEGERRDSEQ